jgi:riboflavin transporter FmnP
LSRSTRDLVLAAFFLALGLLMPFLTAQIPSLGARLLPMHIPVLICGFVLGGPMGLIVGFITPLLRSLLIGMPPMFPTAVAMAFELAAYGLLAGMLYKKTRSVYPALLIAMVGGRMVWGVVSFILYGLSGSAFTLNMFVAGALINAVPGIIFQIIVIPLIIIALQRARLI